MVAPEIGVVALGGDEGGVVALLDAANALGVLADVSDESGYWEKRDTEALVKEVGEWNALIAGFAGKLKDKIGDELKAPVLNYPNFEHLEADGRKGDAN